MPTIAGRQRPIEKFAQAASKCGAEVNLSVQSLSNHDANHMDRTQATAYGKCIVADYQSVHEDMCAKEFMRLKDCYLVHVILCFLLSPRDS